LPVFFERASTVGPMRSADRSLVLRWLLLAVVAFGLVAMHHLPAQHGQDFDTHPAGTNMSVTVMDPSPAAQSMPDSGMGSMSHECLAVTSLFTVAALVMLLLLVGASRWARQSLRSAAAALARARDRPPRWGGRTVLASVCVLRL
jgi:Family of unknown function (DUF6153)